MIITNQRTCEWFCAPHAELRPEKPHCEFGQATYQVTSADRNFGLRVCDHHYPMAKKKYPDATFTPLPRIPAT